MNNNETISQYSFSFKIGSLLFEAFLDEGFFSRSDWCVDVHNHPDYELHFILNGKETLYFENQYAECSEGSFYLIYPVIYHKQVNASDINIRKYCLRFHYRRSGSLSEEDKRIIKILSNFKILQTKDNRHITDQLESIQAEMHQKSLGFLSVIQGMLMILFTDIFRCFSNQDPCAKTASFFEKDDRYNMIDHFFAYHYLENPRSRELADLLHVSESQLNRILIKKYNASFTPKLLTSKIEAAKVLLATTRISVQEIAGKIGYQEASSFCMMFKKKTGVSPEAFRNQSGK